MKSLIIDYDTAWTFLPWAKINEKVFIIQKKIYQYAKECDIENVHRLQKYIINSSDIKVLAIQVVLDSIQQYYLNYNQEKYIFNDIDKLLIYESLYSKSLYSQEFYLITDKIKQYLIYLCIKPEWEARFEPIYKSNLNYLSESCFLERLGKCISSRWNYNIKVNHIYSINNLIINKYIDIIYLNNKMQSFNIIHNYLNCYLKNQDLSESLNFQINNLEKWNICTHLYKFLYKIILNGIHWFNIMSIQTYRINTYNICKEMVLFFDNKQNYWIFTKKQIVNNICFNNIKIFYHALGISYDFHKNNYIFKRNREINLISDYLIKYINKNTNQIIIQIKPHIYRILLNHFKSIVYHKNDLGKYRLNIQKSKFNYFKQLDVKLIYFFRFYSPVINLHNLDYLFQLSNQIGYKLYS